MNGAYKHSSSLEGQLAAVAMSVIHKVQERKNRAGDSEIPSISDFEEAFRVHLKIADLKTRLDERDKLEKGHADRRADLVQQLYILMAERPAEFQF
jgi:hypothetical protein